MDPNAALAELREMAAATLAGEYDAGENLARRFLGLDEWISKGGVFPDEWGG